MNIRINILSIVLASTIAAYPMQPDDEPLPTYDQAIVSEHTIVMLAPPPQIREDAVEPPQSCTRTKFALRAATVTSLSLVSVGIFLMAYKGFPDAAESGVAFGGAAAFAVGAFGTVTTCAACCRRERAISQSDS